MLKSCPDAIDVTDLQFKLQCRLKVFQNEDISSFPKSTSLVSCASRYGLLFIGTNSNYFQVLQTQHLFTYSVKDTDIKDYLRRTINIPSSPKHICANCDNTILAVVVEKDLCPVVIFYEILAFLKSHIRIIKEIRLSPTPNIYVREISWNPSNPTVFTACKSDGTLGVYDLKGDSIDINELPAVSGALCFCWSPKGKQIAVGSRDGKITQYKPDLKAVKIINEPKFEGLHSLISLQWVSNYQFIGVYQQQPSGSSYVVVVDAPKTGEPSYTNYDDICYSGSSRPSQFYIIFQQTWNLLMVASANSTELSVLGHDGNNWIQWIMSDSARAELPLSLDHQETYPVGVTFDISSITPLPWGESAISPCPLLCILSHQGILCCFNVVYLKKDIPSICTSPDFIQDTSGVNNFIPCDVNESTSLLTKANFETLASSNDSALITSKPTFSFGDVSQSTPSVSGKFPTDPTITFGDQLSLTPIKASTTLFGGQTLITPISKVSNITPTTCIKQPLGTSDYSPIFSALNSATVLTSTTTTPVKPTVITATSTQSKSKLAETVSAVEETSKSTSHIGKQENQIVDPNVKAEINALLCQMVKDELLILEAELKVLLKQGQSINVTLGTEEEKISMVQQIECLQNFLKEVADISIGQSSEIHCLKQNVIQSWAWFEEAKSHYNVSKNEAVVLLLKLQPLDSVSEKRLKDIEQLIYYVKSQISQASKTLDEQWDNFQDYAKKIHRVQMPTMETIFQTMVRQNAILQRQTYVLKDISMRIRKRTSNASSLLLSLDKVRDLTDDLKELHLNTGDVLQLQYQKIKHHMKSLSTTKAAKLNNLLKQREINHITAVKPQLSSWGIGQSPASKIKQSISILGTQLSSVSKVSIPRNLDFVQSTPLKSTETNKPGKIKGLILSAKPDEETLNVPTTSSLVSSASGFIPVMKSSSGISSTKGSAFVPTGPSSNVVTSAMKDQKSLQKSSPFFVGQTSVSPSTSNVANLSFKPSIASKSQVTPPTISTQATQNFIFSIVNNMNNNSKSMELPLSSKNVGIKAPSSNIFSSAIPNTTSCISSSTLSVQMDQSAKPADSAVSNSCDFIKPVQTPTTTMFSSQLFPSFTSKPIVTSSISTTTTSSSGVASIFSNLQTMSAKPTNIKTSVFETSKPTLQFGVSSGATTTAASSTKNNFETSLSSTKNIFGNLSKVPEEAKSVSSITNIPEDSAKVPTSVTPTTNILGIFEPITLKPSPSNTTPFPSANQPTESVKYSISTATSALTAKNDIVPLAALQTAFLSQKATVPSSNVVTSQPITTTVTSSMFNSNDNKTQLFEKTIPTTTTASLFKNTTSKPSLFGSLPETSPVFGNTLTSKTTTGGLVSSTTSIFGNNSSSAPENIQSNKPLFGKLSSPTSTTSSDGELAFKTPTSVFGTSTSTNIVTSTTPSNIFGTSSNIFQTANTQSNIFQTANTQSNIFQPANTQSNIFSSSSTNNIFGQATSSSNNIFGAKTGIGAFSTPATVVTTSIFSSGVTAVSTSPSVFGNTGNTSTTFGTQSGSIFGTPKSTSSIFGQPPVFGNQGGFATGQIATTTASSIFGSGTPAFAASTTTTSGNIFGNATPSSSSFGSAFGSTPSTNTFATTSPSTGTFGFGNLNVASTTSSSGNIFGGGGGGSNFGQTATENPFGKADTKSSFGATNSNIFGNPVSNSGSTSGPFGNPTTSTGSVFGSNTVTAFGSSGGAFESQSTFGSSPFSQKPAFGQSSTFSSSSFGSPQAGPFSGGSNSSVAQSGFGSPTGFQKQPGFAAAPVFGGSPSQAFGSPPSFGGAPTFGTGPTFGSPEKVFGATQPNAAFGSTMPPQQNTGFGNLTSQNTIGFGNLAQQANTPTSMPFSGGSSFSTWR